MISGDNHPEREDLELSKLAEKLDQEDTETYSHQETWKEV